MPFRQAICNEVFEGWKFGDACRTIRQIGYDGIEIAPFTLAEDPATVTPAQRAEYRSIMEGEGLAFVGLHWIMVSPKGLHVTTPDDALRARSWQHIHNLVDLAADLGPNAILVFGSPAQRRSTGGATPAEATKRYVDGLAKEAPHAEEKGVTILIEALPAAQSDVVLTLEEAAGYVRQIGSPAIQTMFDVHNGIDEAEPHAELIEKYAPLIRHVHVNELDGKRCGTGNYDFGAIFRALKKINYQGWVSLEAFDFREGPEAIATESLRLLKRAEEMA